MVYQPMAGIKNSVRGETTMKDLILNLSAKIQTAMMSEEGQDVIEYALVIAFVAFAATAGMTTLAGDINAAMASLGVKRDKGDPRNVLRLLRSSLRSDVADKFRIRSFIVSLSPN